jgi:hypothetical protein
MLLLGLFDPRSHLGSNTFFQPHLNWAAYIEIIRNSSLFIYACIESLQVSYLIFLISQDQVGTLSHLFHRYIFHFFQYQAFRYPPSTIRYQIRRSNTAVTCPLLPTSSHIFPRTTNRTRPLRERSLPQRTAAYQRYRIAILVSYP